MENEPVHPNAQSVEGLNIQLSPEVKEMVMAKVDDINRYGTAFTWVGSQDYAVGTTGLGIGEENSRFRSILKNGLAGVSPERRINSGISWGVPNSAEEYVKDLKDHTERPPEVFFNIVGRWGNSGSSRPVSERTIEMIPIYKASRNPIIITFSLDNFSENNIKKKLSMDYKQNQGTRKGTFTVHNYNSYNINEIGDVVSDPDYGFKLASRVKPRMFTGIVFKKAREIEEKDFEILGIKGIIEGSRWYLDDKGTKWRIDEYTGKKVLSIEETDPEALRTYAEKIANDLLVVNEGKEQNLVPIYDVYGNLWWPDQVSHDEIVKMMEGKKEEK